MIILYCLLTPIIRAHETIAGTKNAAADKKKILKNRVGIFKRSSELNWFCFTAVNGISKTNWPFLFPYSSYNFC